MKFLFGNWLNDDLDVERAWPMVDNERKSVLETNHLLLRLWAGPAGCHFGCSDDDDDDDDDDIYIMVRCLSRFCLFLCLELGEKLFSHL